VPIPAAHLFHGRLDFPYSRVQTSGLVVEFRVD
jgi:hypothetical protein